VVLFGGQTHALIPLFAIGVFLCFTLSQAGMVRHWQRHRGHGWRTKLAINGLGALTTAVVTVIVAASKLREGAWVVLLLIPLLAFAFAAVHAHYAEEAAELALDHLPPPPPPPSHNLLIPVARLDRAVSETVSYARSIGGPIRAVHVVIDPDEAEALRRAWQRWGVDVPLVLLPSPYRTLLEPLLHEIRRAQRETGGPVTVLLPQVVPRRWWQEGLHNQTALSLQVALRTTPNIVVATLPIQLER